MTRSKSFATAIMVTSKSKSKRQKNIHIDTIRWCILKTKDLMNQQKTTTSMTIPERLLPSMCANVLPQVAECSKVFCASLWFTVECLACVKPLVCFQSTETRRKLFSLNTVRLEGLFDRINGLVENYCKNTYNHTKHSQEAIINWIN